ncbi:MAG: hypothetical protein Q4Q62_05350 [Thermoplasmata archaeon]|nr:hypothetical protein [Thermoplasmata archaeon]
MTIAYDTQATTRRGGCPFCTSAYTHSTSYTDTETGQWEYTVISCADCNATIRTRWNPDYKAKLDDAEARAEEDRRIMDALIADMDRREDAEARMRGWGL